MEDFVAKLVTEIVSRIVPSTVEACQTLTGQTIQVDAVYARLGLSGAPVSAPASNGVARNHSHSNGSSAVCIRIYRGVSCGQPVPIGSTYEYCAKCIELATVRKKLGLAPSTVKTPRATKSASTADPSVVPSDFGEMSSDWQSPALVGSSNSVSALDELYSKVVTPPVGIPPAQPVGVPANAVVAPGPVGIPQAAVGIPPAQPVGVPQAAVSIPPAQPIGETQTSAPVPVGIPQQGSIQVPAFNPTGLPQPTHTVPIDTPPSGVVGLPPVGGIQSTLPPVGNLFGGLQPAPVYTNNIANLN